MKARNVVAGITQFTEFVGKLCFFSEMMENIIKHENYSARRSSWTLDGKRIFINIAGFVICYSCYGCDYYQLSYKDFEATDWELIIYEPETYL